MILLSSWILRDFNPSNEIFGCLWVFWHTLAKGSDFHKDPTNFLKLFAKYDEPRLFRWSLPLFKHVLSMLLLSMKDKPLLLQKRWSFSLILAISSLKSWWYLLIKLDMTTLGGFCLPYSSVSFTSFFVSFTVLISFSISFTICLILTRAGAPKIRDCHYLIYSILNIHYRLLNLNPFGSKGGLFYVQYHQSPVEKFTFKNTFLHSLHFCIVLWGD